MKRPELKGFFSQLESLSCLHVTPGVNDATGLTNTTLITEARDRLGFTFEVPIVPAGIQDLSGSDRDEVLSEPDGVTGTP